MVTSLGTCVQHPKWKNTTLQFTQTDSIEDRT